ncbi:MAG: magnesium transporter [Firmicutes bacterium]|jgi:magnesium transporter|nr:magnesium transporter [Bacillota bacterium]
MLLDTLHDLKAILFAPDNNEQVLETINHLQPYDLALLLLELEYDEQQQFIEVLPLELATEILEYLEPEVQYRLLHHATEERAMALLRTLPSDTAVDLLLAIHPRQAELLMGWLPDEYRERIDTLMTFPENTAGSLATVDYIAARESWTIEKTLAHIRKVGRKAEIISYIYVVSARGQLIDVVSLKEMILAPPQTKLSEIVSNNPIVVRADSDQEEAARLLSQYDFLAIPVIDAGNRLVGVISVDDLVDVIQAEATEDIQKLGGSEPLVESYLKTPVITLFQKRVWWLLVLFFAEAITGNIMRHYEDALTELIALSFFIPLLIDAGGNSGSQTVTTLVRALALGEIDVEDTWKAVRKEMATGLLLGAVIGGAAFIRAEFMGVTSNLGSVVGISAFFIIAWASTVAAILPMILHRLNVDPAVVSGPLITTLVDGVGILVYFNVAKLLLGI